jgi:hypothetical protein
LAAPKTRAPRPRRLPLGDAWIFSRSRSRNDVSPLIALACALHTASVELEAAGATVALEIF